MLLNYFEKLNTLNRSSVQFFKVSGRISKFLENMYFKLFIFLTIFSAIQSSVLISGFFSAPKKDSIEEIQNGHVFECPKSNSHGVFTPFYISNADLI